VNLNLLRNLLGKLLWVLERFPVFGGFILCLGLLGFIFYWVLALAWLALKIDIKPSVLLAAGSPIVALLFPFVLLGFVLVLEQFWMFFGIYRMLRLRPNMVREALLHSLGGERKTGDI